METLTTILFASIIILIGMAAAFFTLGLAWQYPLAGVWALGPLVILSAMRAVSVAARPKKGGQSGV